MNENSKILSKEEMDAILSAAQEEGGDLSTVIGSGAARINDPAALNQKAWNNIGELTWAECEKNLCSFLRKKVLVKSKSIQFAKLADALQEKMEKHVFTVFKILPHNCYAVTAIDMPFLHQATNFLFGGQTSDSEPTIESPGKIGKIIAEKLCQMSMEGFSQACKEYGNITFETVKTVTLPNLITKLSMEDEVYASELIVSFGDTETSLSIMIAANFLFELIPENVSEMSVIDDESWRGAIQSQVVDSQVTVTVSLPEVSIKASDLLALKNGQLIPIGDPTQVYVCLNNKKLFLGNAAQANANRVVKITNEI